MEIEETKSYRIFLASIKTNSTKENYVYWLNRYLAFKKAKNHDELLLGGQDQIQTDLENYVMDMKNHQKSKYAINITLASLFLFFEMNRIILNKRIINQLAKESEEEELARGIHVRQAYTSKDIKAIIQAIDVTKIKKHRRWVYRKPRAKSIILFFASSGIRLGALPKITLGDLTKIENCYRVQIYPNTKSQYTTFISPEASLALDEYLATRQNLTKDDLVFNMKYPAIRKLITRLVFKAKVIPSTLRSKSNNPQARTFLNIPIVHGFRYFYNTTMKGQSSINVSCIESMMGHSHQIKLDESYFKPTDAQLFTEYKKGIESLTIFKVCND